MGVVSKDPQKTGLKWLDMSTNPVVSDPTLKNPVADGGYEISNDADAVCGGGSSVCGAEKKIAASWKKQRGCWVDGETKWRPLSGLEADERAGLRDEGLTVGALVVEDMG